MNDFVERYRWFIFCALIVIIIAGISIVIWDRSSRNKTNTENQAIVELQKQNDLLREELSNQSSTQVAGVETAAQGDLININTASAEELDKLPNIGPARAAYIIAYREENNGFSSIEELKNISGIGDKTLENMKDLVTVGEQ